MFTSIKISRTIVDEGASISILSSITWKSIGSCNIEPTYIQLLVFNRSISEPLGVLPQFPITLGGKTINIDVMVMQGPLDFNFVLDCDYIYSMKVVVSTLF